VADRNDTFCIKYHGKICYEGKKVRIRSARDSIKLGIEMVYQNLALFENINITGNIFINRENEVGGIFGQRFMKWIINEKKMDKISTELLNGLRINISSVKTLVRYLSGGQRQSVAIAKILLFKARVIIMDEPTSALAVKEVGKILELILELKKQNKSIVIISHRMEDIFKVADRVVVLKRGRNVGDRNIKDTNIEEIVHLIVGTDIGYEDDQV